MKKSEFHPFENESDCIQIGDLTIENRVDRVSIYGSIDVTRDKVGLKYSKELKVLLESIVSELNKTELPELIAVKSVASVKNPFE